MIHSDLAGVKGVRNLGLSYLMCLVLVDYDLGIEQGRDNERYQETWYDVVPVAM